MHFPPREKKSARPGRDENIPEVLRTRSESKPLPVSNHQSPHELWLRFVQRAARLERRAVSMEREAEAVDERRRAELLALGLAVAEIVELLDGFEKFVVPLRTHGEDDMFEIDELLAFFGLDAKTAGALESTPSDHHFHAATLGEHTDALGESSDDAVFP